MLLVKLFILIPAFILLLIASPFIYILGQILVVRWRYRNIPNPKVRSFLLGHTKDLLEMEAKGGHYAMLVVEWSKHCGTTFVLFLVNKATVICLEPSVVRELLMSATTDKPKPFFQPFRSMFGERCFGDGLFTQLSVPRWMEQRKALNPAFKRSLLMESMKQHNASCKEMVEFFQTKADGKTVVVMGKEINKVILDITVKFAFNMKELKVIKDEDTDFSRAGRELLHGVMVQYKLSLFGQFDPRRRARREREELRRATRYVRRVGRECITKRFQDMKDGKECPDDVLTHMLKTYLSGQEITEAEMDLMEDEFVTFYLAGQETSTQMISFTLEYVGRHPEVYQKLQEEVDRVIGDKDFVTYEDLSNMEYMSMVLKESLRIAPPVTVVHRQNAREIRVNGITIPAGTDIEECLCLLSVFLGTKNLYWTTVCVDAVVPSALCFLSNSDVIPSYSLPIKHPE